MDYMLRPGLLDPKPLIRSLEGKSIEGSELLIIVCNTLQVDISLIKAGRRHRELMDALAIFCYIFHVKLEYTLGYTATQVRENYDHASVFNQCKVASGLLKTNKAFLAKYELVISALKDKGYAVNREKSKRAEQGFTKVDSE